MLNVLSFFQATTATTHHCGGMWGLLENGGDNAMGRTVTFMTAWFPKYASPNIVLFSMCDSWCPAKKANQQTIALICRYANNLLYSDALTGTCCVCYGTAGFSRLLEPPIPTSMEHMHATLATLLPTPPNSHPQRATELQG